MRSVRYFDMQTYAHYINTGEMQTLNEIRSAIRKLSNELIRFEGQTRPLLRYTARRKKDIWLNIGAFKAPDVKPATEVDYGIGQAWEFTDGTDDTIESRVKLPADMDKSVGITILICWSTITANAGNCRWQVEYLYRQEDEAMNAAADATLTGNFAASSVAHGLVVSETGTTAVPNTNDVCTTLRIKRRADEAADTLGEDNYLLGVCFQYVSNKRGSVT